MEQSQKDMIKREVESVKELGEKIGYGNMMCIASALWRKKLKEKDLPSSGAFIPTFYLYMTEEGKADANITCDMYDNAVNY